MIWMSWPVSSHRLHGRSLRLPSADVLDECTLLPFFNNAAVIERVMVVTPWIDEILFFDPADVKLSIPLWGTLDISTSLRVLAYEDFDQLFHLWHFDPWWVLTSQNALQDPRAQFLKQTNCVNRFLLKKCTAHSLLYSRDLRRALWIGCNTGQSKMWKRFRAKLLPERPEPALVTKSQPRGPAWQLAPFWELDEEK